MDKIEFSECLLEIAKNDMEASKLLYSNSLYPQSVHYLQQAVEKAAKSIGLSFLNRSEDELNKGKKKIAHQSAKVFTNTLDDSLESFQASVMIMKGEPEIYSSINRLFSKMDSEVNFEDLYTGTQIVQENYSQIIEDIEPYEALIDLEHLYYDSKENISKIKLTEEDIQKWKRSMLEMISDLRNLDPYASYSKEELDKIEKELDESLGTFLNEEFLKNIFNSLMDAFYPMLSLFLLSLITDPHHNTTRYPIKDKNPLIIYDSTHPILENYQLICEVTERTLHLIEKLYNKTDFTKTTSRKVIQNNQIKLIEQPGQEKSM